MDRIALICLTATGLSLCSCKDQRAAHTAVVTDWFGREIVLPDELVFQVQRDTIDLDLSRPDFKIVNYVDSTGCTSCRMKLGLWSDLINEFKSLPDIDIEVVTVVNNYFTGEMYGTIIRNNYLNPIAFDPVNTFDRTNALPPKSDHHCFLLDADNKVIAIGNPVLNPKIKDLYRQCIMDCYDSDDKLTTRAAKPLGVVHCGNAATQSFYLNSGASAQYTLQAIVPSCDCVNAIVDTQSDGSLMKVDVTYTADSIPGAFIRYVDVFFNEKDYPERLTVYGYVK